MLVAEARVDPVARRPLVWGAIRGGGTDGSHGPTARRAALGRRMAISATTITVGVLIALSFDALLQWNAERTLVNEARAMIALEITDNQRRAP